jgi:DNA-binding SARP family transcriptional activator
MNRERPDVPNEPVSISILRGVAQMGATTVALTRRDLELIFILPADGRCVAASRLADALWPEADPADALNSLHVAIHRLRERVRDAGCIRRERFGYRLGVHVTCDLHEIAARLQASRPRGATLDEAERRWMSDAYERLRAWPLTGGTNPSPVSAAIETRVESLLRTIAERTARHELLRGGFERALHLASAAIERDACDEAAFEIAIRAHLGMRNGSEAVRAYRAYAGALACELELRPSALLRDLIATRSLAKP